MAAGSIIVDLLLRTGSFQTDTKRAERALKELKKEAQDAGRIIGAGLATAAIGAAYFVKSAIDTADAAGKSAQAAGLAVESYTALAYAAELSGVETAALGTSLNFLNKAIAGNDKAFETLGISVRTLAGDLKGSDVVLTELADKFAAMPEGPRKAQLAIELFGKSGAQLLPLLNQGAAGIEALKKEAERLGVVISGETAKAAEEFNDNMTRLQKTAQGVALAIAKEVLPALERLSKRVLENAKDFGVLRGAAMALFEELLGGTEPADILQKQIAETRDTIKGLEEQIARAEKAGGNPTGLKEMREELARLRTEARGSTQALVDVLNLGKTNGGAGRGSVNPDRVKFEAGDPNAKKAATRQSEAQRYLETLQKQSEETLDLTTLEKALLDIQLGRISGITPELKKQILAQAEFNDLNKQAIEFRNAQVETTGRIARAQLDEIEAIEKGNQALRDEINLIGLDEIGIIGVERARVSSLRALKEETAAKREAAGESETTLQALYAEIAALREREALLGKKIDRSLEERSADAAKKSGAAIKDTLGDSIEQGILDGFRRGESLTDIFLNELKAQFAKTILRPVIQPIADAGNSLIGDILGAIGGAIGGGGGFNPTGNDFSATGADIRGRRARGGDVHPGGDYWVGEEGPERFRPSTSGRIIPANQAMGGDVKVVVNAPPGTTVERQSQRQTNEGREVELWLASRIRSGQSPVNAALKARGVNTSGNLPRRD